MKRSNRIGLLALSTVSIFALAGCYEDTPQVSIDQHNSAVYSSVDACLTDAKKTGASTDVADGETISPLGKLEMACVENWRVAQEEHARTAPRYTSLAQCEAEFGDGNCGAPGGATASNGGGSNSFMPFLMGYMLADLTSSRSYPVYADRNGGYRSTSTSATSRLKSSSARMVTPTTSYSNLSQTRVTGGKVTAPKATMQTSSATRKSGFGASRSSSTSGRSSFGG